MAKARSNARDPVAIPSDSAETGRSDGRSRSPERRTDTEGTDRSLEELVRLGWTKRNANKALRMYSKWGYDEISKEIQRKSKDGFISM